MNCYRLKFLLGKIVTNLFTVKACKDEYEIGTEFLYDIIWVASEPWDGPDNEIVGYELMQSEFVH